MQATGTGHVRRLAAGLVLCFALTTAGPHGIAGADDNDRRSSSERKQDRAQFLRERSKAEAREQMRHRDVYGPITHSDPDSYYALSLQIQHLAGILQAMRRADADRRQAPSGFLPALPLIPGDQARVDVQSVYGPDGPTETSVRLLLEYRLLIAGNPRLKIGEVVDSGETVIAQVVTQDGSLVEEYAVDKRSGGWRPIR